ncbi:MAG TPA: hypothetical protein VMV69_00640 [Pirellulales bacterium]|nr:hypothetical protein [Pirellulales bacterium]
MKIATSAFLLLAIFSFSPASAPSGAEAADGPAPKSADRARDKSLDDELLKGLADETVEGLDVTKDEAKPPDHRQPGDDLDDELLRGLGDGEDVTLAGGQDPLSDISGRMREVERLIAEADAGESTQGKQREIAEEMEKLIRQLRKRCQACKQSSSQRQETAGRGKVVQPDQANQPTDQPASDSSDRLNDEKAKKPGAAAMREMAKAAWGHLPEHLREQMTQSPTLEFLPQYLLLIEDYYKTLAKSSEKDRK